MKKFLLAVSIGVLSLSFAVGDAEAKRLGGGKSSGTQRESVTQRQVSPAPSNAAAPTATPPAAPKRNWMGPLAGLAAGLGIAALLSHFGMGEGMGNILMIVLFAAAAYFAFKYFMRRKETAMPAPDSMRYAGIGGSSMAPPPEAQPVFLGKSAVTPTVAAQPMPRNIPNGFDIEGFLRVAKLNFIRLQTANDAKNFDDIRDFVSPEMFAEIKMQMDERGSGAQHTDVVTLNAELLEVLTEGTQHIASVRFSGMIREEVGAAAAPFDEVWNLSKPLEGNKGWTIDGIQQLG